MDSQTTPATAPTASLRRGEPGVQDEAPERPSQSCSSGCACSSSISAMAKDASDTPAIAAGVGRGRLPRWLISAGVFFAAWLGHFAWLGAFPEECIATADSACAGASCLEESCADEACETPSAPPRSLMAAYMAGQHQYLGFSYAASLAFATAAFGRYRQRRTRADRNLALGGITISGFLAVAGCFLVGCCGSPMLVVWLNLFGAKFLPFAKPLMAGVTVVSLGIAWWWMKRKEFTACSFEP